MTLLVSDDTVTVHVRWTGTHTGSYGGVPATNRVVDARVISIWRFVNNKVVENWTLQDQFGLLQQVGYLPANLTSALLPHGPHNVRDVLATHILKQTGSYEQASYAIQDTPEMVAEHYGRFLPQDKSALAARILNKVWEEA